MQWGKGRRRREKMLRMETHDFAERPAGPVNVVVRSASDNLREAQFGVVQHASSARCHQDHAAGYQGSTHTAQLSARTASFVQPEW